MVAWMGYMAVVLASLDALEAETLDVLQGFDRRTPGKDDHRQQAASGILSWYAQR